MDLWTQRWGKSWLAKPRRAPAPCTSSPCLRLCSVAELPCQAQGVFATERGRELSTLSTRAGHHHRPSEQPEAWQAGEDTQKQLLLL